MLLCPNSLKPLVPLFLSDMKKLMMALAAALMTAPVMADPIKEDEFFTPHAQGCMLLQECTDHVQELKTVSDLNKHEELADIDYSIVADEFNSLVRSLNKVGAKVFLADMRYFPVGHRGVYHTVGNNFFLNVAHMHRPGTMMSVMRHEGWHAAQDCMAGTIENNFIAIIQIRRRCSQDVSGNCKEILICLNQRQFPGRKKHTGQVILRV